VDGRVVFSDVVRMNEQFLHLLVFHVSKNARFKKQNLQ
jgi:hypothetical protein